MGPSVLLVVVFVRFSVCFYIVDLFIEIVEPF